MSKALDKLEATVNESVKDGSATKNMTRDQLLDYALSCSAALKSHMQFFNDLGASASKLHDKLIESRNSAKNSYIVKIYNMLLANLTGVAKSRLEKSYWGAIIESAQATIMVLDEVSINIEKLFVDKTFNLYNTKISHVAIYGILDNASTLAAYMEALISAITADSKPDAFKVAPYQVKYLAERTEEVGEICCHMINGKLGKTFAAGIIRYKQSGNDVGVLTSDNQSGSKFAKLSSEVAESDIRSGCKGLRIFRIIGDFWTDFFDKKAQKMRALREQHKARVEFLQMELEGEDPNSERYKRIVKIIKNYQDLIDRLNQKLDKYYNED